MKLDNTNLSVDASELDSSSYGIKTENIKFIIDILRNRIYSDKILAIIREYSTNANDAHIEAGIKRPIKVSFPTSLEDKFKIRDFGHGLSKEEVFNIYCTYGESTKRNSNEQNGLYGLGSKSAFAYSNNFNVTSYHKGVMTEYCCYIDENNMGKVSVLMQEPTHESGIEISIPISNNDIQSLKSTALRFYSTFSHIPETNDTEFINKLKGEPINDPQLEYRHVPDDYFIIKRNYGGYSYNTRSLTSCVIMGGVCYPFNYSNILAQFPDEDQSNYRELLSSTILYANVGDISIPPSREVVEYSGKTNHYIFNRVKKIREDLLEEKQKEIKNFSNNWDRYIYSLTLNEFKRLVNDQGFFATDYHSYSAHDFSEYCKKNSLPVEKLDWKCYKDIYSAVDPDAFRIESLSNHRYISISERTKFIFTNETAVTRNARLRSYLEKNPNNKDLIIIESSNKDFSFEKFFKQNSFFDGVPIIDLSKYEPQKRKLTVQNVKVTVPNDYFVYFKLDPTSYAKSYFWVSKNNAQDKDTINSEQYYIIKSDTDWEDRKNYLSELNALIHLLYGKSLYGIAKSKTAPEKWINAEEAFKGVDLVKLCATRSLITSSQTTGLWSGAMTTLKALVKSDIKVKNKKLNKFIEDLRVYYKNTTLPFAQSETTFIKNPIDIEKTIQSLFVNNYALIVLFRNFNNTTYFDTVLSDLRQLVSIIDYLDTSNFRVIYKNDTSSKNNSN